MNKKVCCWVPIKAGNTETIAKYVLCVGRRVIVRFLGSYGVLECIRGLINPRVVYVSPCVTYRSKNGVVVRCSLAVERAIA
jgi:hypothetical protein